MTDTSVQLGDIGTKFLVTIEEDDSDGIAQPVDVSQATLKTITIMPEGGSTPITKAASFETDGTDGKIFITSESGDLSTSGSWQIQGRVTLPGGDWRSKVGCFSVKTNLA